jgi:hypothetical protein
MRRLILVASTLFLLLACGSDLQTDASAPSSPAERVSIDLDVLEDKIRGGWAGQMIGVSYGAPTEFRHLGRIIPEEDLPQWTPEMVKGSIRQDDLYVDMTFVKVLDDKGWDATTEDFGAAFRDSRYPLWHANYAARRALRRGFSAMESGTPAVNPHANDIDFQIEADFIGLMTPGMPQSGAELALRVGRVMNAGDGILGGVFVGGLYSAAFFESDPRRIVEAGLASLPPESPYAGIIAQTLAWSKEHPDDWTATWQMIENEHGTGDVCPQGAARDFNIDARLNGAYVALGLLYGEGDFEKTLLISTRAGQDSDCNPASAVGVLGVVMGYDAIPEKYSSGIAAIADEKFSFTDYSFSEIVDSNLRHAIAAAERGGGSATGPSLEILLEEPTATEVEVWDDYGEVERIETDDPRIVYSGFELGMRLAWGRERKVAVAEEAGAEAALSFEGTGVIVTAIHGPDGGTVEVFLDGEPVGVHDTFSEDGQIKLDEALWHRFGLEDGEHQVRLRLTGEPYVRDDVRSEASRLTLQDIVVFR